MQGRSKEFESDKELTKTLFNNFGYVIVFVFYAQWNQNSVKFVENFKQSLEVFGDYENVKYFILSAEKCPQTFKKFSVQYTPTVIFTQTDKKILKKYESSENIVADIGTILEELQTVSQEHKTQFEKDKQIWHPKIKSILNSCPVIVFVKGTPAQPKCGFTETMFGILKQHQVEYTFYDIIQDEYMRYWLRQYKGWPTYPQIYINGQIIGGLDKVKELVSKGEFAKMIPQSAKKAEGRDKYQLLIKQNPIIAFINGFTFENEASAKLLERAVEKYGEEKVNMVNVAMDEKLKDYVTGNVKPCPFLIENGKIVDL